MKEPKRAGLDLVLRLEIELVARQSLLFDGRESEMSGEWKSHLSLCNLIEQLDIVHVQCLGA